MFPRGEQNQSICRVNEYRDHSEVLPIIPVTKLRPTSTFSVQSRAEEKDHNLEFVMQE